jgi:hypothetical protein
MRLVCATPGRRSLRALRHHILSFVGQLRRIRSWLAAAPPITPLSRAGPCSSYASYSSARRRLAPAVSLGDSWCDTTSDVGRLVLAIMGGIAEFERSLIRKRCQDGIDRAKAKGTKFGRKAVFDAASAAAWPSVTLPGRRWQSWRASTSAARRRSGARSSEARCRRTARPRGGLTFPTIRPASFIPKSLRNTPRSGNHQHQGLLFQQEGF